MKSLKIALIASSFSLTSCASLLGDRSHSLYVTSEPSGATVVYEGHPIGKTPTDIKIRNTFRPGSIQVTKKNYDPVNQSISTSFQLVGIVNVLWWPGFFIDMIAGNTMALDQHQMNFVLQPQEG
jgi:hypothetical protein